MAPKENIITKLRRLYREGRDAHSLSVLAEQKGIDVAADAATILNSAAQAVQKILDRCAALDAVGQQNDPLVVVGGEIHNVIAHVLHHVAVLDGLKQSGEDVSVCFEGPHNLSSVLAARTLGFKNSEHFIRFVKDHDPQGHIGLQQVLSRKIDPLYQTFHDYLKRQGLAVCFNDAASCMGPFLVSDKAIFLDRKDASTNRAIYQTLGLHLKKISVISRHGMNVRNVHMAALGTAFAATQKSRILYQQTGNAHVYGYKKWDAAGQHSLSRIYKDAGIQYFGRPLSVLAMAAYRKDGFTLDDISDDHNLTAEEMHHVMDLPPHVFRDPYRTAYLNALLDEMGLGDYKRVPEQDKLLRGEARSAVSCHMEHLKTVLDL